MPWLLPHRLDTLAYYGLPALSLAGFGSMLIGRVARQAVIELARRHRVEANRNLSSPAGDLQPTASVTMEAATRMGREELGHRIARETLWERVCIGCGLSILVTAAFALFGQGLERIDFWFLWPYRLYYLILPAYFIAAYIRVAAGCFRHWWQRERRTAK